MRWVCVEVLGRDLWSGEKLGRSNGGAAFEGGGKKGEEWVDLCALWKGVRGLRLGIKGSVRFDKRRTLEIDGSAGWNGELGGVSNASNAEMDRTEEENGLLNTDLEWIQGGLLQMTSLGWIELEIEDGDMQREAKFSFCQELATVLNKQRDRNDGRMDAVEVIFVERIRVDEIEEEELTNHGGASNESSDILVA